MSGWHQRLDWEGRRKCWRVWSPRGQVFEFAPGIGVRFSFELPTTWHDDDEKRLHFVIQPGFGSFHIMLPWWGKAYPDFGQCCGPQYGLAFHNDMFWLYFGQDTGHSKDPRKHWAIDMPWNWGDKRQAHDPIGQRDASLSVHAAQRLCARADGNDSY